MTDAEALAGLPGIEQLRRLMTGEANAAIGETVGFRLTELAKGRVVFEAMPERRFYNPIGTVHGGFAATLLDSACGCAVHSMLEPGQRYTTLELKVAYHRALTEATGRVRAIGTVLSIGRRAAFAEARLVDDADRLHASATSTLLVMA